MNTPFPKLYTEAEAAQFLRVRPCTVRNERVRGNLGYILVGRRVFYMHEHLVAYLEARQVAPNPSLAHAEPEPRRQRLDLRTGAHRAKGQSLKQAALLVAQAGLGRTKNGKEAA